MDHLMSELGGSASTFGRQAVHQVRTNIMPRVERELRDNVVPTLERKGKQLKERWTEEQHTQRVGMKRRRRRPRPPSNTDIVYLTERFLVSSKPAVDRSNSAGPKFLDKGRDISSREAREAAETAERRQSKSRHDRIFRQRGNPSRLRHSGTSESIEENFDDPEEHEPSTSSIPEEEGHDPPINDNSSSERESTKFSENPQDGGAASSSPTQTTTSSIQQVEPIIDEEVVVTINDLDEDPQSPDRKPSASSPSNNDTDHSFDVDTPVRSIAHSSFHSNKTDLVVNHREGTDHSSTTHEVNHEEAATPLIKNAFPRVISNLDEAEKMTGDGPPLIPSMPLPPSWGKATGSKPGSVSDGGDTSVASFATCKMDDDTFDATPEPQPESLPEPTIKPPQHSSMSSSPPPPASTFNSPGSMVTYLDKVHGRDKYLAVSLAKEKPDDRTLLLFRRQIVPMGLSKSTGNHSSSQWSPCCVERSETPSIPHVLKICYALHAFLHLDPNNVVLAYCDNGKTRTAIVAACYLRFSNMIEKTEDGFRYFLSTLRRQRKLLLEREKKRRKKMGPLFTAAMDAMMEDYDGEDYDLETNGDNAVAEEKKKNDLIIENIMRQIPPSLKLFFEQFDRVLQLGGFLNQKPLLLRAIMLQGVPVEDQPCIDIWDSSQKHVYSSHPPVSTNTPRNNKKPISQWVDEEGFYRINVVLDGEFLVLCRFGGDPVQLSKEQHIHDPSKILFRYTNTTGFMSGGCPYELPAKNVDLMRLYADHLDDEEFLLTFLFEADWEHIENDEYNFDTSVSTTSRKLLGSTSVACGERIWRAHEVEARDEGWRIIFENHCARPAAEDMESFRLVNRHPSAHGSDFSSCPDHLIMLSLQLTNYDFKRAAVILLNSPVFSWWREDGESSLSPSDPTSTESELMTGTNSEPRDRPLEVETGLSVYDGTEKPFREIENEATKSILDILDSVDVTSNLDPSDQNLLKRWRPSSPRDPSYSKEAHRQAFRSSLDDRRLSSDHLKCLSTLCLKDTGYLIPSVIYPHRGDIARSFHIHGTGTSPERRNDTNSALQPIGKRKRYTSKPRIPYFSSGKAKLLPAPSRHIPDGKHLFDSRNKEYHIPVYDSQLEATKELHSQLHHTGMTLGMLLELQNESQKWTGFPRPNNSANDSVVPDVAQETATEETPDLKSSMNQEEKGKKEKEWQDAQKAEAEERRKSREQEKATDEQEKVAEKVKAEEALVLNEGDQEVPLKDDPEYEKYFKMLRLGMPREQVLHAFQRDGKDPKILDLDPNKSLESQVPSTGDDEQDEVPLKDDPEYEKYFKMLKLGMPREQVLHAFQRDGKDPTILDLDPNKSLESQLSTANTGEDDEMPLEEDPEYVKYFKMLKLGMPKEQVLHALKRDDKNPKILDLDPKKSLKSQEEKPKESGDGIPLKDDPEYSKYFKMMKMGMPKEQVSHALKRDGKDPTILDLDPNKSLKSQEQNDDGVPLKDDPQYSKYFKMEQVGLPRDAVKNALLRDGKDPSIIDLDPNKSLKAQISGELEEKDTGIPMKDDPEYAKYFKMEKMGMPKDVVRNALVRDGKNPAILEFDQNMSVEFQLKKLKSTSSEKPAVKRKKKKKIRRKKIYWNPVDPKKLKDDSLWNIVRDHIAMGSLEYDQKEFEELFTESAEAGAKEKKKGPAKKEAKKAVQAIDPKRSMNGGIVLSRIKTDREKVAEFVDKMDHTKFNGMELKNLKEYLATSDERNALEAYMSNGAGSEEKKEQLFKDLSETEKYMVTLMKVSDAEAKLHTMEFRDGFKNRFSDITSAMRTLNTACDELRTSEKFRKLMAMILTVVNQINTGGEGNLAMGFSLDALLKLNEAKAFDKKTSVLHYVVKLVKKNDESLLYFENDLGHVISAESVLLDTLVGDVKALQNELGEVIKIVTKDADRIEKSGDVSQLTLAELVEQKSIVQHLGETPQQANKSSNLTGRTPMERFSMNAKVACEQAIESINDVQAKYSLVLGYFGEDEKLSTGDFFGILRRFMSEWKKATKQVEKIERKKEKERKREAKRAAKAKAKKKAKGLKSSSRKKDADTTATKSLPPLDNGIAALAAEAAIKSSKKKGTEDAHARPPVGGIAALAAQAALKKARAKEAEYTPTKQEPPAGGIAALAAQAALKKAQVKEAEGTSTKQEPSVGGIAALAAQAALKKAQAKEAEDTPTISPAGGIAALVAQAALKKAQVKEAEDTPTKQETSAGGNAAISSQTAVQKADLAKESPAPDDIPSLVSNSSLEKRPSLGEMAELAAKAVVEISKIQATKAELSQQTTNSGRSELADKDSTGKSDKQTEKEPFSGKIDGIASESSRKQSPQNGVPLVSSSSGMLPPASKESLRNSTPKTSPTADLSSLGAQVALELTPKQSPHNKSPNSSPRGETSSLVAQVALEKTPEHSPQNKTPNHSPRNAVCSLAAEVASSKQSPSDSASEASPSSARSSLAAQVALEETRKQSPQDKMLHRSPTAGSSSVATQVLLENTLKQSPKDKMLHRSPTGGSPSIVTELSPEKTSKQSPAEKSPQAPLAGELSSLAAQVVSEKSKKESAQPKTPQRSPVVVRYSPSPEKDKKQSLQPKTPQRSPVVAKSSLSPEKGKMQPPQLKTPQRSPAAVARSSLSLVLENLSIPSPKNKSPHRSPTSLISSLAMALENAKQKEKSKKTSPSLGSFFEKQNRQEDNRQEASRQEVRTSLGSFFEKQNRREENHQEVNRQEVRNQILKQNYDDSSVAMMAENLQKVQMHGNAWNQGGGIADYMGWANQAIKASDTDSVRDFETARDMVYDDQSTIATGVDDSTLATNMDDSTHATNFDDGTIATNFDDDASIGTAMTPRNDHGYSEGGGRQEYYNSEQYDNYIGSADDPYNYTMATDGTQNPYGDSVINMPLEFTQDQGLNNGLSFGDEGFDGPGEYGTNAMVDGAGAYGDGLVGFGQDPGLGGFGMASPTPLGNTLQNDFSNTPLPGPPLGGGNPNLNLSWGATPTNQPNRNNGPWSAEPDRSNSTKTDNSPPKDEGVVFRGWGDTPKTPEQAKRKNWFWN